jgi:thioredoxin 1
MTSVTLTSHDCEEIVSGDGIVFVDFWAAWCRPCQAFAPVFEEAARNHPDIVFGKVDTDAEQELAAAYRITSIPTLMAFRDGILVFSQPGALRAPPWSNSSRAPAQSTWTMCDARSRTVNPAPRRLDQTHVSRGHCVRPGARGEGPGRSSGTPVASQWR